MKYLYGMKARGVSPGAQPKGLLEFYMDQSIPPRYWNVIAYRKPLSDSEIKEYDLVFLGEVE